MIALQPLSGAQIPQNKLIFKITLQITRHALRQHSLKKSSVLKHKKRIFIDAHIF